MLVLMDDAKSQRGIPSNWPDDMGVRRLISSLFRNQLGRPYNSGGECTSAFCGRLAFSTLATITFNTHATTPKIVSAAAIPMRSGNSISTTS